MLVMQEACAARQEIADYLGLDHPVKLAAKITSYVSTEQSTQCSPYSDFQGILCLSMIRNLCNSTQDSMY